MFNARVQAGLYWHHTAQRHEEEASHVRTKNVVTTSAPTPSTTVLADPPSTVVPDPPSTVVPDPQSTVFPGPPSTVFPGPPSTVVPDLPSTSVPDPQSTVVPDPPSTVVPDPPSTVVPDPPTTIAPNPPSTLAADPPTTVAPDPLSTSAPNPPTNSPHILPATDSSSTTAVSSVDSNKTVKINLISLSSTSTNLSVTDPAGIATIKDIVAFCESDDENGCNDVDYETNADATVNAWVNVVNLVPGIPYEITVNKSTFGGVANTAHFTTVIFCTSNHFLNCSYWVAFMLSHNLVNCKSKTNSPESYLSFCN